MITGDIIVSHGTGIIGKIIQKYTHSYWSHCAVAINEKEFVEATWPVVRVGNLGELMGGDECKILTHVVPLNVLEQAVIRYELVLEVGKKYDWRGLLSFIIGSNVQNKSWYFCSELVKEKCELVQRPLLRRNPYWTTPDDIYSSLMLTEI